MGAAPEDVAFSADGARVAVTTTTGLIHVYETTEAGLLQELAVADEEAQHTVRFGPDRTIVTGGAAGTVHVWAEAAPVSTGMLNGHSAQVNDLAFNSMVHSSFRRVRTRRRASGTSQRSPSRNSSPVIPVISTAWPSHPTVPGSPPPESMGRFDCGMWPAAVKRLNWPMVRRRLQSSTSRSVPTAHESRPADQTAQFASGTPDRAHSTNANEENQQAQHAIHYNASGNRIAACGHAGTLTIFNSADGASLFETRLPAASYLVGQSTDASRLVAACADGVVRIVDVPANAR